MSCYCSLIKDIKNVSKISYTLDQQLQQLNYPIALNIYKLMLV